MLSGLDHLVMVPEAQLGEEVGIVGKGIGIWDGAMWGMRSGPAEDIDTLRDSCW